MNPQDDQQHYFSTHVDSTAPTEETTVTIQGHNVTVTTGGGVFSKGHLDHGTATLLRKVPPPAATGVFVDVGCGWGPITLALALASPDATVWGVDVNERARELTAQNAQRLGLTNVRVCAPEDFPHDQQVDLLWSNPPVRIGKPALRELLVTWAERLATEGEAWLVVQKNLGADSLLTWLNTELKTSHHCVKMGSAKGFRVLKLAPHSPANA